MSIQPSAHRSSTALATLVAIVWVASLTTRGGADATASTPAAAATATAPAHPAPDFQLPTRHGSVTLQSLRGRVVLVDFWASWCQPCKRSFPWLKALHEQYGPKGLAIVAITVDKDRAAAEAFLTQYPAPFMVAFDPDGKVAERYKLSGMPTSYLIDRSGALLHTHAGFDPKAADELEILIKEACAQ